jgi:hypothetical protein
MCCWCLEHSRILVNLLIQNYFNQLLSGKQEKKDKTEHSLLENGEQKKNEKGETGRALFNKTGEAGGIQLETGGAGGIQLETGKAGR